MDLPVKLLEYDDDTVTFTPISSDEQQGSTNPAIVAPWFRDDSEFVTPQADFVTPHGDLGTSQTAVVNVAQIVHPDGNDTVKGR